MNIQWVWPYSIRKSSSAQSLPSSAVIISVNGAAYVGKCGGCGAVVSAVDTYIVDEATGRPICASCLEIAHMDGS